jgi:hypothetical protein
MRRIPQERRIRLDPKAGCSGLGWIQRAPAPRGQRFESPQLHQEVRANRHDFLVRGIALGTQGELIFPNTRRRSVFRECDARRTGSPRLQSCYGARIPFDIRTILMACARLRWRISTSRRPRQLTSAGKAREATRPHERLGAILGRAKGHPLSRGWLNADFCRSSLSTEVYSIATQKGSRTRRGAVRGLVGDYICKVADRIGARRPEFFSALPANAFSLSHSAGVGPCARSRHIGLRRRG